MNSKTLKEKKYNLNFFFFDYFAFFVNVKFFKKNNFLLGIGAIINKSKYLISYNYVLLNISDESENFLSKFTQIRKRTEKILIKLGFDNFFKKINFILQVDGNSNYYTFCMSGELRALFFSCNDWCLFLYKFDVDLGGFFKTNFFRFLDDTLLEKDDALLELLNLKDLQMYKFTTQQQKIIDLFISKQNHSY